MMMIEPESRPHVLTTSNARSRYQKGVYASVGVLLVFLLGVLVDLRGWIAQRGDYSPFGINPPLSAQVADETQEYAAPVGRFLKSKNLGEEPDLYELGNPRVAFRGGYTLAMSALAYLTGSSERAFMLAHGLFPALVWALVFLIASSFGLSPGAAFCIGLITVWIPFGPRNSLLISPHSFFQPLEISRTPNPSLSFGVLLLLIYGAFKAITEESRRWTVLAAIALGTLFYLYYYYWVTASLGLFLLLLEMMLMKRRTQAWRTLMILCCGFLLGTYFFYTVLTADTLIQGQFLERVGRFTHEGSYPGAVASILTGLFLIALYRYKDKLPFERSCLLLLIANMCAAAALGMNLQVISGYDAQHLTHFPNRCLQPLVSLVLLMLVFSYTKSKIRVSAYLVLAGIAILSMTFRQLMVSVHTSELLRKSRPVYDVLNWLKDHAGPSDVLLTTHAEMVYLTPTVAGMLSFVPDGGRSFVSSDEARNRFIIASNIDGSLWKGFQAEAPAGKLNITTPEYLLFCRSEHSLRPNVFGKASRMDFSGRKVDYIVLKKGAASSSMESTFNSVSLVYSNSLFDLYRVLLKN